jgi:shikimate 5-dehydrogenase
MKAAVLGSPIAHSLSPVLHLAAYQALGLADWSYEAIECDEAGLPALLAGCGPEWTGLSLTMPLKRAVLPLLDEAEPLVGEVGAANTVVFSTGARHGYNTDVPGMTSALREAGVTREWASSPRTAAGETGRAPSVLILGAGATACSALGAVRGLGVTETLVAVRDPGRTAGLLAAAGRMGVRVTLTTLASPLSQQPGVLISTLPGGAADPYAQRIAAGELHPHYVFDVVYNPWPTPLATAARAAGAVVVNGFALLLHQAAEQVSLMTGKPAPVEVMRAAGLARLSG